MTDPSPGEQKILVIDDELANVQLLQRLLAKTGYDNVRGTTDPTEVESLYTELKPDLILLDLHMPIVDGFGVMQQLSRLIPEDDYVPILVLTADVTQASKHKALAGGANDFLTKPFDRAEVLARVGNLLNTRFLHTQLRRHSEVLEKEVAARTRELERSLEELKRVDSQRELLLSRLVTAQEEERKKIAGDIHDDSVQVMAAALIRLGLHRERIQDPHEAEELSLLEKSISLSIARLRSLLFDLRPPALEREGLVPALHMYLDQMRQEVGLDYDLIDVIEQEPPVDARVILYRIAQEALTNVRKHAAATRVVVALEARDGGVLVRIEDDGVGFSVGEVDEPRPGHLGLAAIHERAAMAGGSSSIDSAPGRGTRVEFWLPLNSGRQTDHA